MQTSVTFVYTVITPAGPDTQGGVHRLAHAEAAREARGGWSDRLGGRVVSGLAGRGITGRAADQEGGVRVG